MLSVSLNGCSIVLSCEFVIIHLLFRTNIHHAISNHENKYHSRWKELVVLSLQTGWLSCFSGIGISFTLIVTVFDWIPPVQFQSIAGHKTNVHVVVGSSWIASCTCARETPFITCILVDCDCQRTINCSIHTRFMFPALVTPSSSTVILIGWLRTVSVIDARNWSDCAKTKDKCQNPKNNNAKNQKIFVFIINGRW